MWDIILDAFLDTLKVFPFLLVIYILIEFIEHKTTFTRNHKILQGNLAPLIGSATGLIPQCGFSVMAAKLYDRGLIRTGTLLAVLIATSDEASAFPLIYPPGCFHDHITVEPIHKFVLIRVFHIVTYTRHSVSVFPYRYFQQLHFRRCHHIGIITVCHDLIQRNGDHVVYGTLISCHDSATYIFSLRFLSAVSPFS